MAGVVAAVAKEGAEGAEFLWEGAPVGVVVAQTEDAEEVGAGEDEGAAGAEDAGEFVEEGGGLVDVFEDIEGADGGVGVIGGGDGAAVEDVARGAVLAG